jgi:hypothetical protein
MPERPADGSPDECEQTAAYVADVAGDLARIARTQGLHMLGYLLEMARLEALSHTPGGAEQRRRLN